MIHTCKVHCLLNISACGIKTGVFEDAVASSTELLKIEPNNQVAFWRRAKARSAPINAGVPEFREALKDLAKIEN